MQDIGTLYIVATPIGNLSDISLRAVEVLKTVNYIAAEDTRHAQRLLQHYQISTPTVAYHEHNEAKQAKTLVEKITKGLNIALISDAGTPLINDPGYTFVQEAIEQQVNIVPIPGASALIAALSASGLACDKFCYEGFLPAKANARMTYLENLSEEHRTLVFYEAPHRIVVSIEAIRDALGAERKVCVAREITKTYETFLRGSAKVVAHLIKTNEVQQKGEFVIIVEGKSLNQNGSLSAESIRILKLLLKEMPIKPASKLASKITGEKKNRLYGYALELR